MTVPKKPPFKPVPRFRAPYDVGAYVLSCLRQTKLLELYELNRQDFVDIVGIWYFTVISIPDHGYHADIEKGFASFCEVLKQAFLTAPSQLNKTSVDPINGLNVNFVGAAILEHLGDQKLKIQDLYSSSGRRDHALQWQAAGDFVLYAAIEAFKSGITAWTGEEFAQAKERWMQLQTGERKLRTVGPGSIFKK